MKQWTRVQNKVLSIIEEFGAENGLDLFFRGQSNSSWQLSPGLARQRTGAGEENRLFYGFTSLGAHLFPQGATTWDTLFMMQHYGIPTRLLDWSESFAVALYFAIKNPKSDGAVWILNPYRLNSRSLRQEVIVYLNSDFPVGYQNYFIDDRNRDFGLFPGSIIAIGGSPHDTRMRSQRGVFTLHHDLDNPLDNLFPDVIRKVIVPKDVIPEAGQFLRLAGINEYTLFPDLDGLARFLKVQELIGAA